LSWWENKKIRFIYFHPYVLCLNETRRNTVTMSKYHWTTKWTVLFLALALLWGGNMILPQETGLEGLFKWAVKNYLDGKYREVIKDLELLLSYCDEEHNQLKGKIYLLLGAAHEQLGSIREAKKNYQLSSELLPDPAIEKIDLTSLKEYRLIIMNKEKPLAPGIIEKPKVKPVKRKPSMLYLVLGGVALAGVATLFLLKRKDRHAELPQYYLSLHVGVGGSVHKTPGYNPYAEGTPVTLTASPHNGWLFAGWSGDINGMENPVTIIMDSNKIVNAAFSEITPGYSSLAVSITGRGNVTLDPLGGTYPTGTMVRLTAAPDPGWEFSRWYGDLDDAENPTNIIMDSYKNVTAAFIDNSGANRTVGHVVVFPEISTSRQLQTNPFVMPENGTINSITMYHLGGVGRVILGVYDGQETPQNRLGLTPGTTVNSSDGWQTINLTSPVSIRGGQTIWLAWVYEQNPGTAYEEGTPGRYSAPGGWGGGMPENFVVGSGANYIYSIYATYTPD
jgi:hypothetical protein